MTSTTEKSGKIKIGFPFLKQNVGPKIFLRRLKNSIEEQKLASTCSFIHPFHDVDLFNSIARDIYGKPYVLRIDGIYFDSRTIPENAERNKPIFDSIDRAGGIVFQSQFSKQLVEAFYGTIEKKQAIIFNGTRVNKENVSFRKELKLPGDKKIILCASHWRRFKRLPEIIEIVRQLNREQNDYHLVILGKNAQPLIKADYVDYRGEVEPHDLFKYYKSADLFIHLAWIDNCPNTVVEAIANGLPVICSNQGGTREIVELTKAGIVTNCDEEFTFREIDLYNPPKIDIEKIVSDVKKLFGNYAEYKRQMKPELVDIDFIAKKYVEFIKVIC